MTRTWRTWLKDFTPPLLWRGLGELRHRLSLREWEVVPAGWQAGGVGKRLTGWNAAGVAAAQEARWPKFVKSLESSAAFDRAPDALPDSPPDLAYHNAIATFGYVLARAAWNKPDLTMLDWGGGIGQFRLIGRCLMPQLKLDYHCKDVPLLAELGQKLQPEAHFYADERCLERHYDLVMASTSLHYSEDWAGVLGKLAKATSGYLYVTGLPAVERKASFVFVQRPYHYGYATEYLGWCLNRPEFIAAAQSVHVRLVQEFSAGYRPVIYGAPEQCEYRGFLFVPDRGERSQ